MEKNEKLEQLLQEVEELSLQLTEVNVSGDTASYAQQEIYHCFSRMLKNTKGMYIEEFLRVYYTTEED